MRTGAVNNIDRTQNIYMCLGAAITACIRAAYMSGHRSSLQELAQERLTQVRTGVAYTSAKRSSLHGKNTGRPYNS